MCSPLPSASRQRGFTLIELMIGVAIGLLASLAVTQVLVNFESQKRSTTSGSDAQINGALALDALQRAIQPAGYGFGTNQGALGCTLVASYGGAAPAGFPAALTPLVITDGASGAPDTLSVLASGKRNYSIPLRIVSPGSSATAFPLQAALGVEGPVLDSGGNPLSSGDLLVAITDGITQCDLFQATAAPASNTVPRGNGSNWNQAALANNYVDGSYVVNLGTPSHRIFDVSGGSLRQSALLVAAATGAPSYSAATELFPGIVNLQAQYGRDTNADGSVDTWDNVTPTTNAGWRLVLAVRLAVVARSSQYDADLVTRVCPTWDGGTLNIPAAPKACASYPDAADEEWKHYRYKVFDTVVPLRNLLWSS